MTEKNAVNTLNLKVCILHRLKLVSLLRFHLWKVGVAKHEKNFLFETFFTKPSLTKLLNTFWFKGCVSHNRAFILMYNSV